MRTLLLHSKFITDKQMQVIKNVLDRNGFPRSGIMTMSIETSQKDATEFRRDGIWWKPEKTNTAKAFLASVIDRLKPKAIICNDNAILSLCLDQKSRNTTRGSIYKLNGVPCLVVDDIFRLYQDKSYPFFLGSDLAKLKRYVNDNIRREPSFNYTICTTVAQLDEFLAIGTSAICVSSDIETSKTGITSVSCTCLTPDGVLRTFVVPIVNPLKPGGCHWETLEDELYAWSIIKVVHESPIPKFFQNGCYDCAWFLLYHITPRAFFFDTMHMWRCIWPEAEKALDVITSVCVDTYRYWKNDIKGEVTRDKKTKEKSGKSRIPKTEKGYNLYLRYNGLDTHFTALDGLFLCRLLCAKGMEWAFFNYCKSEWPVQIGPNFAMTMRGLRMNKQRQAWFNRKWLEESAQALENLRVVANDPTFNPNSPKQFASLLFDVLGAKMPPIRGKGIKRNSDGTIKPSVDEKVLKFVKLQHPILEKVIQTFWDVKKPLNNASKYGEMRDLAGRYLYSIAMLTECNRASSTNHPYWYGTNAQNIPVRVRPMFVSDTGMLMCNSDLSSSDAFFVAFSSEDPQYIENILSPKDTHCLHTEFFFAKPYDEVYTRYKQKDPWAVDPIKGVRQNTKRITHGAGYQMQGQTLYITMGHEAVVATAIGMGHTDAGSWKANQCQRFAQTLVDKFLNKLYPGLPKWFTKTCEEAIKNKNKVIAYGGRTRLFFGDIARDHGVRREISAYYGQGGTAAKINHTLLKTWYSELEITATQKLNQSRDQTNRDFALHLQVHDSIVTQISQTQRGLDCLDQFLTIMEEDVTILGRTFKIPVESEVGLSWEGASVPYKKGMKIEDLMPRVLEAERKLDAKFGIIGSAA